MLEDWMLSLVYAASVAASTMPVGFMLGSGCSPCCGCKTADGKPRTDPRNEGTWVPSGTWLGTGGVTWTFTANPGDGSGETWFFNSVVSDDWGDICNWYSSRDSSPSGSASLNAFPNRATRLPPSNAIVHIYAPVRTTGTGPVTVKSAYFWNNGQLKNGSTLTTTSAAYDSDRGSVLISGSQLTLVAAGATLNGGAFFVDSAVNTSFRGRNLGVINGGATFTNNSFNDGTVNGGAVFYGFSDNGAAGTVNGGCVFNDSCSNFFGTVNGGATFNDVSDNEGTVNDGAAFNDSSINFGTVSDGATFYADSRNHFFAVVNGGAEFSGQSYNGGGTVNGGATFNDTSQNLRVGNRIPVVNGGASFNDSSTNYFGIVEGGATFNDSACSTRTTGFFSRTPCDRKFVAHPTDLPTCNGSAPSGCANAADTCGCG